MFVEEHKSGKINFGERYKNPYTGKWQKVTVLMEKDTPRIRKEAQRVLQAKIAAKLSTLESSEMPFTELFNSWWTFHKQELKRPSIASLQGNVNEVREHFGIGIKVTKIDVRYVQHYLDNLECSVSKKERTKTLLNQAFDYAVSLNIIQDNPARRAKLPRVKKTLEDWKKIEQKYLEENEIQPFLKEFRRRPNTYRLALLAEFISLNGGRISEIVSIEPANINFETRILQLHGTYDHTDGYQNGEKTSPKTPASYRETFMTKREMEIIKEFQFMNEIEKNTNHRFKDMGYIFTTKNGVPIQTNSFNEAAKKANLRLERPIPKEITSHIFRHTLVSRLAENGTPLKAIMERVGHSDAKTTIQIYTHVTKKMKTDVTNILEKY